MAAPNPIWLRRANTSYQPSPGQAHSRLLTAKRWTFLLTPTTRPTTGMRVERPWPLPCLGSSGRFLSVRRELIGRPGEVKTILMQTATSLNRHQDFQGAGVVDLLRALPSGHADTVGRCHSGQP